MKNKFGLTRYIPDPVKRQIRQHCGFGCAICGATITEYEHFFPDYSEAMEHNPEQIVLLCPTHHALVSKRIIPKEQVKAAYDNPAAKKAGFSSSQHPWFEGVPSLKMGGGPLIVNTPIPIQIKGENIIHFEQPEDGSKVARISASLRDASGSQFLQIQQNEWKVLSGAWDFQCVANRYIFTDNQGTQTLRLRMEAPNFIAIELLRTSVEGIPVHITEDHVEIQNAKIVGGVFSNSMVGFSIS